MDSEQDRPAPVQRAAMATVVIGLAVFAGVGVWLQFVRTDLDWLHATLSLYLHGPYGLWLRSAYCLLALAITLLGWMLYRQMDGAARRGLPAVLFGVAGLGLAGVAIGDSWLPGNAPALAPFVHALSAQTAFLCVTVAMLLQAWCFGRDRRWQWLHRRAWEWAWLTFALLWLHVLWRASPRGLGQKLVIALVVGWLLGGALALWRAGRKEPAETSGSGHNGAHTHSKESPP
jgi:hypothetical protein